MRLHKVRMRGDNADTEAVHAALACGNGAVVEIIAVGFALIALIKWRDGGVAHLIVIRFAVVGLDPHVLRIDTAEMHLRGNAQRIAD